MRGPQASAEAGFVGRRSLPTPCHRTAVGNERYRRKFPTCTCLCSVAVSPAKLLAPPGTWRHSYRGTEKNGSTMVRSAPLWYRAAGDKSLPDGLADNRTTLGQGVLRQVGQCVEQGGGKQGAKSTRPGHLSACFPRHSPLRCEMPRHILPQKAEQGATAARTVSIFREALFLVARE